ncbi:hypothetical protein B0J13DRAFT_598656 [Dactylonectria estremocensis]|uniref:Zona occludens toxin N-terminal domain-containing protein n=1 Tax=Dactylonectria estremocensis TaxID=1079267 RepID=A0A9P9IPL7_9HYPO|nr:hypothetical protein B0J13DRAFT_598656 [Dactylonectria estremocensis]
MEMPSAEGSTSGVATPSSMEDDTLQIHMELLRTQDYFDDEVDEVAMTPIFSQSVRRQVLSTLKDRKKGQEAFSQFGLLAGNIHVPGHAPLADDKSSMQLDPRIFYNVSVPSSVFICGSQGSGKSHTLSCLLENCLIPSKVAVLPRPLTGLLFHYDSFVSDTGGLPCEAAFLSSSGCVKVKVLCPPTNIRQIKKIYARLPNVTVEELRINQSDLNTKRMLDLMAVSSIQGNGMPLYMHVVTRILRDLRLLQQQTGAKFDYGAFKRHLENENLSEGQRVPLLQRLDTLESFMVKRQPEPSVASKEGKNKKGKAKKSGSVGSYVDNGNDWAPVSGQLTIVDLSCPCVTSEMACALFNICLSLFLEQDTAIGRVVALDEAHKYLTSGAECQTLTESLLTAIRVQRHIGARIIISTQEPTVSPRLLDLCSVTIVHRFSSPAWLQTLRKHLVGVSSCENEEQSHLSVAHAVRGRNGDRIENMTPAESTFTEDLLSRIVQLRRGEALMFAPGGIVDTNEFSSTAREGTQLVKGHPTALPFHLGKRLLKVRVRQRVTADGGRSILAT